MLSDETFSKSYKLYKVQEDSLLPLYGEAYNPLETDRGGSACGEP